MDKQGRRHQDLVLVDADRVPHVTLTPIRSEVRGFDKVHQAVRARISFTREAYLVYLYGGVFEAPEGLPRDFPSRPAHNPPKHPGPFPPLSSPHTRERQVARYLRPSPPGPNPRPCQPCQPRERQPLPALPLRRQPQSPTQNPPALPALPAPKRQLPRRAACLRRRGG